MTRRLKYVAVLLLATINTAWLWALLVTCRTVTGRHLVLRGIRIRRWHRCRKLKDMELVHFFEPRYHIRVDNRDFGFWCENVTTVVRRAF